MIDEIMRVSSASNYDHIALNANIRAMFKKKYHCEEELNILKSRIKKSRPDQVEELLQKRKDSKGCNKVVNYTVDRIGNIRFKTCLCSIKHPLTDKLCHLSLLLDKGILPFKGAALDQPAQVMELLDIVQNAIMREQNEQRKEQDAKRKH